mgnify:CR=1 FL=1
MILGPFFHRGYRVTLISDEAKGWSFLIESVNVKKRFGYFKEDYEAHQAAIEAINGKIAKKASEARHTGKFKDTPKARADECSVPAGEENFGPRLRWVISAARATSRSVARRSGIAVRQIKAWIDREIPAPSLGTIVRLADLLQCRPLWLQDGDGKPWAKPPDAKTAEEASQK